jgi:hypothetical protein
MGEENGNAASFMSFCNLMVNTGWLVHDEILIMDNAAVHTGSEARDVDRSWAGSIQSAHSPCNCRMQTDIPLAWRQTNRRQTDLFEQ